MREEARYGWILAGGSAVLVLMGLIHPTRIPFGDQAALARMAFVDALAHGLAIVGVGMLVAGQIGWSRMLGLHRPLVVVALVAAALPAAGLVVAAALDGFAIPTIAREWMASDAVGRAGQEQLIRFCVLVASSLTRIYMVLTALAVLLWSWVVRRDDRDRALPWIGAVVAIAAIATLVGGSAYVSVHELLVLVAGQAVWTVRAAAVMIRAGVAPVGTGDGRG